MSKIMSDNTSNHLEVLNDDQFIISYPRSGQTWFRSLLEAVREPNLSWIEEHIDNKIPDFRRASNELREAIPKPRLFKTHEYYNPRFKNLIYMVRDPRAIALSLWNWRRRMGMKVKWRYNGDFDIKYIKKFISGKIFPGCWEEHVSGWALNSIKYRSRLILWYEQVYDSPEVALEITCQFLNIKYTSKNIENAVKAFPPGKPSGILKRSIKPIKASPDYWKECYTPEMLECINKRYEKVMNRFNYD